ncbi:MAG: hypothetical protein IT561_18990 [Alphaproteobacteria bacterium]|nr:hypothetical protein [Alphaproteobacteria bacterium]
MTDATNDVVIGSVRKNAREVLVVGLQHFRGHDLVGLRVFAEDGAGKRVPTKAGLNVRVALLDDLIALLVKARDEARSRGMLP